MGLISGLITLPLAPVRLAAWAAEILAEEAQNELDAAPQRALAELEAARASGEISDEEADRLEAQLIDELLERR
jgi:hypothetical protein